MSRIEQIKTGTDNCYLVSEGKNAILVDTCSAAGLEKVLAACSSYDMKLIVITHPHFDHAENAYELSKRLGIPVAMNEADIGIFDSYDSQPLIARGIVGRVVLRLSLKVLRNTKVRRPENLIFVKEGDSLEAYGIDGQIIELPGHTKGSIGVVIGDGDVIVGDQMDNWIRPSEGHLYADKKDLENSMEKLRSLGERTAYYGHGKPTKINLSHR